MLVRTDKMQLSEKISASPIDMRKNKSFIDILIKPSPSIEP